MSPRADFGGGPFEGSATKRPAVTEAGLSENGGCIPLGMAVSIWENHGKSTPWVLGVFAKFQSQMIQVEEVVAADSAGDRTSPDLCF